MFTPLQALCQGNDQEAVAYVQRCREMLLRVPKDVRQHLWSTLYQHYMLLFHIHCAYCCLESVGCLL